MADFKVQRGEATIAARGTSVTLTAGVDYDAPASASRAFLHIVGTYFAGVAVANSSDSVNEHLLSAVVTDPTNILTSQTIARAVESGSSSGDDCVVSWEIIEYVGPAGGANEFVVRGAGTVDLAGAAATGSTAAVSGVVTNADVSVWITGQRIEAAGVDADWLHTSSWDTATQTGVFTRDAANTIASKVSYAVIEWTGSNWTVQRAEQAMTAGTAHSIAITDVGALGRAFFHPQLRKAGGSSDPRERSWHAYLSTTTSLVVELQSGALAEGQTAVVWVLSNSQTNGTPLAAQHLSYTYAHNAARSLDLTLGTTPTGSTALSDVKIGAVVGITGKCNTTATSVERSLATLRLLDASTLRARRSSALVNLDLRFSLVEFPTAVALATDPPSVPQDVAGFRVSPTANEGTFTGGAGATLHRLERSTDNATWAEVTAGVTGSAWSDTTAVAGTEYYYRIVAVNANGETGSGSVRLTTLTTTPVMSFGWSGALSDTGVRIRSKVAQNTRSVRVAYSTTNALTNNADRAGVSYATAQDINQATNYLIGDWTLSGLTAATDYNWTLEIGGNLDVTNVGKFQTAPAGAASFRLAFGNCHGNYSAGDATSDQTGWDDILAADPLMFLHLGDFHYADQISTNTADHRNDYTTQLTAPRQGAFWRKVPIARVWDDHDFCGNDSGSSSDGKSAAQEAYRHVVPSYTLPDADEIYQTFKVGRVRVVMWDSRSGKEAVGVPATNNLLSSTQETWFSGVLDTAKTELDAKDIGLLLICNPLPWIGAESLTADWWGGYTGQRTRLGDLITNKGLASNTLMLCGDMHGMNYDDGTNNTGTTGAGGFAVIHAGGLWRAGSDKGGPYSQGVTVQGSTDRMMYGLLDITDTDGASVDVTFTGVRVTSTGVKTSPVMSYTKSFSLPSLGKGRYKTHLRMTMGL